MQKKQVAVLDFGSSAITCVICERGINKTFIIKAKNVYPYDGFSGGNFFDTKKLFQILKESVEFMKKALRRIPDNVFVGVPGDFTSVVVKSSQISFDKKKKIETADIDALYDAAFALPSKKTTLINRSAVVYELDDYRRLADPLGAFSEILKGKLSFVYCDNYFIEQVKNPLKELGIFDVKLISVPLAESMYLIDAETRDRIAVLCDIGYISTTFTVIQGDGIVYQNSFDFGGGYLTAGLCERFDLTFEVAENLKRKLNLCEIRDGILTIIESDDGNQYRTDELIDSVYLSLDELCEKISASLEDCGFNLPEYVQLFITGGGISFLRGAKEHVASRLNMPVSVISAKVPMMESPSDSSLLSLLDMAIEENI